MVVALVNQQFRITRSFSRRELNDRVKTYCIYNSFNIVINVVLLEQCKLTILERIFRIRQINLNKYPQ